MVAGMSVFFLHNGGKIIFWTFGLALCVFVGPTQSASRSFLGRMIPEGREGGVLEPWPQVDAGWPRLHLLGNSGHHFDLGSGLDVDALRSPGEGAAR